VINGADELQVTLQDGKIYDAEVVGADASSDLAVIRIHETNLPYLTIPTTSGARVGEWVLAFGSPLSDDLGNTVTAGIVSAVRRTSTQLTGLNAFAAFIQTDAAINPGNSGGPLVDLRGNLVGINSAIYSRTGGSQGVGFAIPADVVHNVAEQLIMNGTVERAALGVSFNPVSRTLAEALNVPPGSAQIIQVNADTPADRAGLKEGDIVTAINGETLSGADELRTIIGNMRPGAEVKLDVVREGNKKTYDITLGKRSELFADAVGDSDSTPNSNATPASDLGFSVMNLTDNIRRQLGDDAATVQGVIIRSIDAGSAAARDADLSEGDIIVRMNDTPVKSVSDFEKIYRGVKAGEPFIVQVVRPSTQGLVKFYTALEKPA
jgi:serine protease Do